MTLLARLKPFNEKKGYLTKIYMIDGYRFLADKGWYEVTDEFGATLKELHQSHYDEESPLLFDVASPDDAEKLEEKEKQAAIDAKSTARQPQKFTGKQRTQALPVNNAGGIAGIPGDLTTEDLYKPIHGNAPVGGPGPASDPESDQNDADALSDIGRTGKTARKRV